MAALLGILVGALGVAASGCGERDCAELSQCEPASCAELTSPDLVAQFGQKLGCFGDWDGGADPACVPRLLADAVDARCGVFVDSNGSPTGAGTKEDPVSSLAAAVGLLTKVKPRLYACEGTFTEKLDLPAYVELYGGLDCAAWTRIGDGTKTVLTAPPGEIPLTLSGEAFEETPAPNVVEDIQIIAADALDPGGSSIAMLARGAVATLRDVVLEAGEAQAGDDGAPFVEVATPGAKGAPGGNACSAPAVLGGLETTNRCGDVQSIGAVGGVGSQYSGTQGGSGLPPVNYNGGEGEGVAACAEGTIGATGAVGGPGMGGVGIGTIDENGYKGVTGLPGSSGAPGQGGGGGGGSKGSVVCSAAALKGGAGGGGGGSGGCGGAGGRGGNPGGSSLGLIVLEATLTFDRVVIKTKNGGRGGAGGPGQNGGESGPGGDGGASQADPVTKIGCKGGPGGPGGPGGVGGGGIGGHSIGIAFVDEVPPIDGVSFEIGQAGPGGSGAPEAEGGEGRSGVAVETQAF